MNVLILAAADPVTPAPQYPVWLSEVDGELLLERQIKSLAPTSSATVVFAFRKADIDNLHVVSIARQIVPGAKIVEVKRQTAGAACTALLAIEHLNLDEEIMVVSATDFVDSDYKAIVADFKRRGADAGVLTFDSLHPRYSYVKTDTDGWVVEAAEKRPISRQASSGFYWFARAGDFVDALRAMILKDGHIGGVFYISPALNELVLEGRKIACWALGPTEYHPVKDDRHIAQLEHDLGAKDHQ